ncbi:hypothetical protein NC652_028740 [Populus alba x Populus x berolinensis]|nr:hypothetical protein NC652_028740 [Populus alba x Populus x berolinensis]
MRISSELQPDSAAGTVGGYEIKEASTLPYQSLYLGIRISDIGFSKVLILSAAEVEVGTGISSCSNVCMYTGWKLNWKWLSCWTASP